MNEKDEELLDRIKSKRDTIDGQNWMMNEQKFLAQVF